MRISSRVDYALSCILRVADRHNKKRPVSVKYVAEKERLATDYVEQLLIKMRRFGILKSLRGKEGGYILARSPSKITAKDVVRSIENEVLELVCFREKGRKNKCIHLDDCKIRNVWINLRESMEAFLEKHTLDELLKLRRKEENWT